MFGRSSDPIKAATDVSKMVVYGGTAKISYSQIVAIISNSDDAKSNLNREELRKAVRYAI